MEVMNQLILPTDLELMDEGELDKLRAPVDKISRMMDSY